MAQAGISCLICPAKGSENSEAKDPAEYVKELASHKAKEIFDTAEPGSVVIGADTIVVSNGEILGKPKDRADAKRMITSFQGKDHQVMTGVAVLWTDADGKERSEVFCEITHVDVYPMKEKEIDAYVATGEPDDKAGAYGIQGRFGIFIKGIRGDYNNVVGLPIARLYHVLSGSGLI